MLKPLLYLTLCLFLPLGALAQTDQTEPQPETFIMPVGDTEITMQKYFMAFLKKGPNRDQSEAEQAEIQKNHLAYLSSLYVDGFTSITGPVETETDLQGFVVFNTATKEQAMELMKKDPAVRAGRLVIEIVPWWAAKGSVLK